MNTTSTELAAMAAGVRRKTLRILGSVPAERHNWRATVRSYSLAERAWFLCKLDDWLLEKISDPENAIFPRFSVEQYDRREDLFAFSVLELDSAQQKIPSQLSAMGDGRLFELVYDERFGDVSWLYLITAGYLHVEIRETARIEAVLEMLQ